MDAMKDSRYMDWWRSFGQMADPDIEYHAWKAGMERQYQLMRSQLPAPKQTLPAAAQADLKIALDMVKVIAQAAPQIWGSDEREMLYDWLTRNTEEQQIVTVNATVFAEAGQ
ncbi:hypothetical protein TFLX_03104 [Thermoflexales bacterium]|nr:hypothetical protein TFLX_03104 [Thermoflexales bacterium]